MKNACRSIHGGPPLREAVALRNRLLVTSQEVCRSGQQGPIEFGLSPLRTGGWFSRARSVREMLRGFVGVASRFVTAAAGPFFSTAVQNVL
jgi:hypothetical protein